MAAKSRTGQQVLTANRLGNGEVIYGDGTGGWTLHFAEAHVFGDTAQAEAALARAGEDLKNRLLLDPYLFDVTGETGAAEPASVRERIRAAGPTVRTDLGKQSAA